MSNNLVNVLDAREFELNWLLDEFFPLVKTFEMNVKSHSYSMIL